MRTAWMLMQELLEGGGTHHDIISHEARVVTHRHELIQVSDMVVAPLTSGCPVQFSSSFSSLLLGYQDDFTAQLSWELNGICIVLFVKCFSHCCAAVLPV